MFFYLIPNSYLRNKWSFRVFMNRLRISTPFEHLTHQIQIYPNRHKIDVQIDIDQRQKND